MPDTYTKEQIDEVKNALREHALMVRETAVDDEDAVHFANDLLFLLAAFESAEQERDAQIDAEDKALAAFRKKYAVLTELAELDEVIDRLLVNQ